MSDDFLGVRSERMPSDADFTCGFEMVRSPSHPRTLKMIIWSHDMLGMRTHYHRGRTGPCWEKGCEACARNMRSRWNGYVLARAANGQAVIFEFTPPAGQVLDAAFKVFGSMRGLQVIASRTSEKLNAKVFLQVKGKWDQAHTIKNVPQTWPVLMHIWGLTKMENGVVGPMHAQEVSEAEMLQGSAHPSPVRKRNQIPQRSLIKPAPMEPGEINKDELLDAIARTSMVDHERIERVNGHARKARSQNGA